MQDKPNFSPSLSLAKIYQCAVDRDLASSRLEQSAKQADQSALSSAIRT